MNETPFDGFDGAQWARGLPDTPGVYRFFDGSGQLLYVGKARSLRDRVAFYFQPALTDPRLTKLVGQVAQATFTVVPTERDALVLESRLIQTQRPLFNVRLQGGHGYPYLHLSTDKSFPQLTLHRHRRGTTGRYFGPYPSQGAVQHAQRFLLKHFGLRSCSDAFFAHRSRPCLEHALGRCTAPCVGLIDPAAYQERVGYLEAFLDGRSDALIQDMDARMASSSERLDFEAAARWRDRAVELRALPGKLAAETGHATFEALAVASTGGVARVASVGVLDGQVVATHTFALEDPLGDNPGTLLARFIAQHHLNGDAPVPGEILIGVPIEDAELLAEALTQKAGHRVCVRHSVRGDRRRQLALAVQNAHAALRVAEQGLALRQFRWVDLEALVDRPLSRLECFDVSHTQGESPVASCVVFGPDGPLKRAYRRYNIEGTTPGDDPAAIGQAVARRLAHTDPLPDALFIDGAEAQVAAAAGVARSLGHAFPIIGVAKGADRRPGEETLVFEGGRRVRLGPQSPALALVQALRDEAHRFALRGHQGRRTRARTSSSLEAIAGIGPARRAALLRAFGGLKGVRRASLSELAAVPGVGPTQAAAVFAALHSFQGGQGAEREGV